MNKPLFFIAFLNLIILNNATSFSEIFMTKIKFDAMTAYNYIGESSIEDYSSIQKYWNDSCDIFIETYSIQPPEIQSMFPITPPENTTSLESFDKYLSLFWYITDYYEMNLIVKNNTKNLLTYINSSTIYSLEPWNNLSIYLYSNLSRILYSEYFN